MNYITDPTAGLLCGDNSDIVATAITKEDHRPFVAYMRHGWRSVFINGFSSTNAGFPSEPKRLIANSQLLSNITDRYNNHMGIFFNINGPGVWVAVWRDGLGSAIWIAANSQAEYDCWGPIPILNTNSNTLIWDSGGEPDPVPINPKTPIIKAQD